MTSVGDPVAVVTGASRGIGAAVAERAAKDGYRVAIAFLERKAEAADVAERIRRNGGTAITLQADVSDPGDVVRLFDVTEQELGPPKVLVNNAGLFGERAPLRDLPPETIARVLAVNALGPLLCCREAVRRMAVSVGGTGGVIVNISSQAARFGGQGLCHYAASKGAVETLTQSLAKEVAAEGIRVNGVSPGIIRTDQHDLGNPEKLARMAESIPLGHIGEPEDVAEAVSWLISTHASYITGAILPVAGGR